MSHIKFCDSNLATIRVRKALTYGAPRDGHTRSTERTLVQTKLFPGCGPGKDEQWDRLCEVDEEKHVGRSPRVKGSTLGRWVEKERPRLRIASRPESR